VICSCRLLSCVSVVVGSCVLYLSASSAFVSCLSL